MITYLQNGITYGVEIETSSPIAFSTPESFTVTRDASVSTPKRYLDLFSRGGKDIRIYLDDFPEFLKGKVSTGTTDVGIEFVSKVLDSSTGEFKSVNRLLSKLDSSGIILPDYRSGIHVHVSLGTPSVANLKNILRLGGFLESAFFLLGGMGENFRGEFNDSIYCRPLTKVGPPVISRYDEKLAHCLSFERLTDPKLSDLETFWILFGDLPNTYSQANRYNPARYFWLNLFNAYQGGNYKGTLEFRIFNLSTNSFLVDKMIELCLLFTRSALGTNYRTLKREGFTKINSAFNTEKDISIESLDKFLTYFGEQDDLFPETSIRDILNIAERCVQPKLSADLVRSHLHVSGRCPRNYWSGYSKFAEPEISGDARNPKFVDVHLLRGERR